MTTDMKSFLVQVEKMDPKNSFIFYRIYLRPSTIKEMTSSQFNSLLCSPYFSSFIERILWEEKDRMRYKKEELEIFEKWVSYKILLQKWCNGVKTGINLEKELLKALKVEIEIHSCVESEKVVASPFMSLSDLLSYLEEVHTEEEFILLDTDYELLCSLPFLKKVSCLKIEDLSHKQINTIAELLRLSMDIKEGIALGYMHFVEILGEKKVHDFPFKQAEYWYRKYASYQNRREIKLPKSLKILSSGKISKPDV